MSVEYHRQAMHGNRRFGTLTSSLYHQRLRTCRSAGRNLHNQTAAGGPPTHLGRSSAEEYGRLFAKARAFDEKLLPNADLAIGSGSERTRLANMR